MPSIAIMSLERGNQPQAVRGTSEDDAESAVERSEAQPPLLRKCLHFGQ